MSVKPTFFPSKRPAEVERRAIDWRMALPADDSIASSAWSVSPAGLVLSGSVVVGTLVSVQISAGVSGARYQLQNTVITAQGFTLIEVVSLAVL